MPYTTKTKSENADYASNRSVADGAFFDIGKTTRGKASALSRLIALRLGELDSFVTHTGADSRSSMEWVLDNFYIIRDEAYSCKREAKRLKDILLVEKLPAVFVAARLFVSRTTLPLTKQACDAFSDALCTSVHDVRLADIYSACLMLKCALLVRIFDTTRQLVSGKSSDAECARIIGDCVASLKYLSYHSFEDSFRLSKVEELLCADPSGAYPLMSEESKLVYRSCIAKKAKRLKISEYDLALDAYTKAKNATADSHRHIGYYLLDGKSHGTAYFCMLICSSVIAFCFLSVISPYCLLLLFPLWEALKLFWDFAFSRLSDSSYLPRISPDKINDDNGTLVVITSLLLGEKTDKALFDRLERAWLTNRDAKAYFGILGDFPDSKTASTANDSVTLEYAERRINSLNEKYGNRFCLFVRERRFSKSEQSFMGWERKRGAVVELVRFIKGDKTSFSNVIAFFDKSRIKYISTLDSDTNIGIGALSKLIGIMAHPLNRPVIDEKRGIVTSGYGVLQPIASPELACAGRTPFSRLMCGEGGFDIYSEAGFDLYQSLFGEGIFCGKGIFDVDAFYAVIDNKKNPLPEDYILSHDSVESALLRCGIVSDITFTDSFPKNVLSYLKRSHRWIRGDVQNLAFLFNRTAFNGKSRFENNISPLSKFKLFDNVRRELAPVFSFACLVIISLFASSQAEFLTAFLVALSPYIVPLFMDVIGCILRFDFKSAARRFYSKGVCTGLWQSFLRMLFFVCALPKIAFCTADAVLVSLRRMLFTKKGLIEWQTFAQSDLGDGSMLSYVWKNLTCAATGAFVFIASDFGLARLVAFSWFIFPVVAYFSSKDFERHTSESKQHTEALRHYAYDIFRFFSDRLTQEDNYLPPDNIQFFPVEKVAHRTSPTNIGLSLISLLASRDFGFINSHALKKYADNTLASVLKLKKCHGHLYNWYDTKTLHVLAPSFVSTVDSGNFIACLITLKEGLREYVSECPALLETISTVENIIKLTDFNILYDNQRNLFSIGSTEKDGSLTKTSSCYDLFMSEALTTSYIAIAKGIVPPKHWAKLSRTLITSSGYIGLASWTGTAFEYFMPRIFLPSPTRSISYEALSFAFKCQRERKGYFGSRGIWGISESAYFAFDSEMNYSYKAFGVPRLGLKRGLADELVISPYSSFLTLCKSKRLSLANLSAIKAMGAYGVYGFYEAIDFTPTRVKSAPAIIKSYMSHHLGMSIASICNACFDDVMCRRFMSDREMNASYELLEEKIPVGAIIRRPRVQKQPPDKPARYTGAINDESVEVFATDADMAVLSYGDTTLVASSQGFFKLTLADTLLLAFDNEPFWSTQNLSAFVEHNGKAYSLSLLASDGFEDSGRYFKNAVGHVMYEIKNDDFDAKMLITVGDRLLRTRLECDCASQSTHCALYGVPVIFGERDYLAHPSFASLFIEARYLENDGILLFSRRKRSENEPSRFLAVALSDKDLLIGFDTRKDDFNFKEPASIFSSSRKNNTGACINPAFLIDFSLQNKSAEIIVAYGECESEVIARIANAKSQSFDESMSIISELSLQLSLGAGIFTENKNALKIKAEILRAVYLGRAKSDEHFNEHFPMDALWRHGISGDIPIVTLRIQAIALLSVLDDFFRCYRYLRSLGILFDMCVLFAEGDGYNSPVRASISSVIHSLMSGELIGRKNGGIFLVDVVSDEFSGRAIEAHSCLTVSICSSRLSFERANNISRKPNLVTSVLPYPDAILQESIINVKGGFFSKNADFTVCKENADFLVPYTHILSGRNISTLLTESSLGYTFCKNASEKRITCPNTEPFASMNGEMLYIRHNGILYELCRVSAYVCYSFGSATYMGRIPNLCDYSVTVYVCHRLRAKIIEVRMASSSALSCEVIFAVKPTMGKSKDDGNLCFSQACDGILRFTGAFSGDESGPMAGMTGFILADRDANASCLLSRGEIFYGKRLDYDYDSVVALSVDCDGVNSKNICFAIGAYHDERELSLIQRAVDGETDEYSSSLEFSRALLPKITLAGKHDDMEVLGCALLFNSWLSYQNAVGRFLARCGYYQSGGAYGFRDQLQDCLCLMYSQPRLARAHLLRCAHHQFVEGDVLHWWHSDSTGVCGVRSRCSDDYLWLIFAVAEYISFSGDRQILKKRVRYIKAPVLSVNEGERYIRVTEKGEKESLFLHCRKSADRALELIGPHGLPLIGSCDWSDGLNRVGENGVGESVWMAMFLVMVLDRFCFLCRLEGVDYEFYKSARERIVEAIKQNAVDSSGKYFVRAFYDDGEILGGSESDECRIDMLPQCFLALMGESGDMTAHSLLEAYRHLFDREYRLTALFTPPFKDTKRNPGYIKGYVAGIRENGGQYTHAAIWGAKGMLTEARRTCSPDMARLLFSMGEDILSSINPIYRTSGMLGERIKDSYRTEPYYLCGDVYTNPSHMGRGGWSLYTGAAGWYFTTMLNDVFGISLLNLYGDEPAMRIKHHFIPFESLLCRAVVTLEPLDGCVYSVSYEKSADNDGFLLLDGIKTTSDIPITKGKHIVIVKFISLY